MAAIFQAFRERRGLKFIDVTTNFWAFLLKKYITKFAGLQTLKVSSTCA